MKSPERELFKQVRALEAEPAQAGLHFRHRHEQLPQEARAMVFHHDDDGPSIDGQKSICVPVLAFAEGIDEAEMAPDPVPVLLEQVPQHGHHFGGQVRQARQRGSGRNGAVIVIRRVRGIACGVVACCQAPSRIRRTL